MFDEYTDIVSENNSIINDLDDTDLKNIFIENTNTLFTLANAIYLLTSKQTKHSDKHCYIQFKASTGGTESHNLCHSMFSNYLCMLERSGIKHEVIEVENNGISLIKSATIKINIRGAYGFFLSEKGNHRFTRISPYGNGKLHTSFVFVDVYPDIDDDKDIEIEKKDIRIDTFRGSGAGGQHRNKTDSAVRITHLPTNIIVKIENDRSQHNNKKIAMGILKAKLYEYQQRINDSDKSQLKGKSKDSDWGSQIRSYTIEQNRVKDHRTKNVYHGNLSCYYDNMFGFIRNNAVSILFSRANDIFSK